MIVIAALILLPVITALLLLIIRNDTIRSVLVVASVAALISLAVVFTVQYLATPSGFIVPESEIVSYSTLTISVLCCAYVVYRGIKSSNYLAILLACLQIILVLFYDLGLAHGAEVGMDLYVDQLSLIMTLIIAVIGGGICIYALGYMRDYQEHLEDQGAGLAVSGDPTRIAEALGLTRDRRHIFFAIMFAFLGAMFTIVLSNRLSWFLSAWEVTTVCSFALIGFSRTDEAVNNSFKAININLAGGIAFSIALIMLASDGNHIFELDQLVAVGIGGTLVLPIMLISFAGMTKAAQMPFQGWLLGAMVAPTPTSALLHSSTMVKAGVFILIKLAPTFGWNAPGLFVLCVGGLTFLCCSALAISQSNAKRVLAYSTVSNLGLIICCAGVGTAEAVWAAIFLVIFHAAAKALLFCCVGTGEHRMGSRDIEALDNINVRMPWLASCMALGMIAMFMAPFGMLVSKWEALVSIAESGHLELLIILAFGSALTFVFWAKWLAKVLSIGPNKDLVTQKTSRSESAALVGMAILLIGVTLSIPYLSSLVVMPYLEFIGVLYHLPGWVTASGVLGYDILMITSIIFIMLLAILAVQILRRKPVPNDTVYMAGVGADSDDRSYYNALGVVEDTAQRNWYMDEVFGEKTLGRQSSILIGVVISAFLVMGVILEMML